MQTAAARELGFDVGVNPSRKRSGMDILARFGEATQSRRLARRGAGGGGGGGIAGMFGKTSGANPAASSSRGKKRASEERDAPPRTRGENTPILFEEVDVLRGEDHFMAALATLVTTTKRPIVLTSNAPSLRA